MIHTSLTILIPSFIAFAITIIAVRFFMGYFSESGVVATDRNKHKKPTLPTSLGLPVVFGFSSGLLVYIFGSSFNFYVPVASLDYIFATIIAVFLISLVGFLDDINVKAKPVKTTGIKDTRKGLKQWQKPLLTFVGAIPLMVINAGISSLSLPFVGIVNFGIFYPLIIIPLAIMFGANAFNLLEGFNGIAAGSGSIAVLGMLIYSFFYGNYTGILISSVLFASLAAAFIFNKYPAKMLPGDSFTYFTGAAIIVDMILGNMESFGIIIFIPWIIEFILHLSKKFNVSDLGILQKNGTFKAPYGKKIYSLTHVAMNVIKNPKEWEVSMFVWGVEALFVMLAFLLKALAVF
ncbi:MAG: hypothetical protein M1382_00795 [Candidatus Marsarchaeota archaeon]|jgi:UDP-N-acetylglucosamine--dolichyl-phosphate N-acetylglucosaminephosphotransferase|nr:hypothetical protein [Candidatus Marsarchaeota archaeon]